MFKFLKNCDGGFAPIFGLMLALLLPILGVGYDYTRVHSFKGKLQSVADNAAYAAMMDAKKTKNLKRIADQYISANLPDVVFESRRSLKDGDVQFQVRSKVKTPLLGLFTEAERWVQVETAMPYATTKNKGRLGTKRYTKKQIKQIERGIKRLIENAPQKYQAHYRKQYDMFLKKLHGGSRSN